MLVVDAGVLVAPADSERPGLRRVAALLGGDDGPLLTTALVIAEAAYLIDRQVGSDDRGGAANLDPSTAHSWSRC